MKNDIKDDVVTRASTEDHSEKVSKRELLNGVVMVIDEMVNTEDDNDPIYKICNYIASFQPVLKYDVLPKDSFIAHFTSLSYIILDWNHMDFNLSGVGSDTLKKELAEINVQFIKKVQKSTYCPIFIFSTLPVEDIENILEHADLYDDASDTNYIMVVSKSSVIDDEKIYVYDKLEEWLSKTPSSYTVKCWEMQIEKRKTELSWDLQNITPHWPSVLWKTFKEDGSYEPNELGILMTRLLLARSTPFNFDDTQYDLNYDLKGNENHVIKILEASNFILEKYLDKSSGYTGDLYLKEGKYLLNIRANCDCIARGINNDDNLMYLIEGDEYNLSFDKHGSINSTGVDFRIYPVHGGKGLKFNFKDFHHITYGELKEYRIGRITSPQIVKAQQKFGSFIQRQGMMRMPKELR